VDNGVIPLPYLCAFQTELKELHKNDIESKDFEALPADIKHEILTELKDAGRKTDWACINSMPKVATYISKKYTCFKRIVVSCL